MGARATMARALLAGAGVALGLALGAIVLPYLGVPWLEQRFAQWATVLVTLALVVHPARGAWLAALEARVERLPRWVEWVGLAALTACFAGYKLTQHLSLNTTALDLSLFESVVDSLVRGQGFFTPWLGRSFLSEHTSFILLAWAPVYALWRGPESLLLLQAVTTAGAAVPLVALARREGLSRLEASVLGATALLNPILWKGFVYDVHPELLLPLLVSAFAWAAVAKRWAAFFVFGALVLAVKEDMALVVAPLCLWLVTRRAGPWWPPVVLGAASLAWMAFAVRVVIPWASGDALRASRFLEERYGHLGHTEVEVVWNTLTHPGWWVEWLFARPSLEFFTGLGFTPLLQPVAALASLPQFFLNRATQYPTQSLLGAYYPLPAFTVLLVAVPAAAAKAKARWGGWAAVVVALSLAWPTAMQVTPAPWLWPLPSDGPARAALARLDVSGGVCTQSMLAPHLPLGAAIELMPRCAPGTRVLLFSPSKYEQVAVRESITQLAREALAGEYGATFVNPSLVVLERGAKGPLDVEARRLIAE